MKQLVLITILVIVLAACGPAPTSVPTNTVFPSPEVQAATRTPMVFESPTPLSFSPVATSALPATAVLPPTATVSGPRLLQNGRGLTTGATMSNGEFQVEGYCTQLNPNYGVAEDDTFWYCTQNGQRVLTLGTAEMDDICFRTYNVVGAYAEQVNTNQEPVYRWRCFINY